ncbi:hypothetical protein DF3PB_6080001 [uncultured Defluviicoccus sp.]|uniref:Uncharacterized protein n=1 Tax=metagenome TaxID=256318 RepID=A0A380TKQ2_9ZZZZ|nr:hypothetical protein DF3PB_6080001 [uncultured Defluviicoccus sp.]
MVRPDFVRHVSSDAELAVAQDRCLIVMARFWDGSSGGGGSAWRRSLRWWRRQLHRER